MFDFRVSHYAFGTYAVLRNNIPPDYRFTSQSSGVLFSRNTGKVVATTVTIPIDPETGNFSSDDCTHIIKQSINGVDSELLGIIAGVR